MTPITTEEFAGLLESFSFLEETALIAVACSGGADSMALTLLLHEWGQPRDKQIVALTVDHGLRPASVQEAGQVRKWLNQRGIPQEILIWQGEKPQTRIQETAREMRYHLLSTWCQQNNISILMTAHHAQDQVETFLMRLAKGSGLRGLCAMLPLREYPPIKLVRPLLSVTPQRLHLTLKRFQQSFIKDPSNEDYNFERVRWRQTWQMLTKQGLTLEALLTTIERLQKSQNLVDEQFREIAQRILTVSSKGYLIVDWKELQLLSSEVLELFLANILGFFSSRGWQPKYQAIKAFCKALCQGHRRIFTLGGTLIQKKGQQLLIFRELRAVPPPQFLSEGSYTLWWDRRFLLKIDIPRGETLTLKAFGEQPNASSVFGKDVPTRALTTLPSFWRGEELFFLPHETNNEKKVGHCHIQVCAQWKFNFYK